MQIHVARQQQQLGVFAPEEILAGLSSGRFHATDLAWREGMSAWTPLGDWPEFRGAGVPSSPAGHAQPADAPAMPSWERGASVGNFIATIKEVALDPVRTFANLREGGYARPISFTYWSLLPAWLCGSLLYGALFGFMAAGAANLPGGDNDPFAAWIAGVGPLVAALAISAGLAVIFLFVPLFNFVGAAVTHLLLLPWGPAGGFAQTYRANAYAYGAFMPFAFVPCLNYVAMPWQLVAAIIAHSQVHRIAWWKVGISLVVIPCLCACGLYALLFAALAKGFAG
ncbi:MAG: GYF domain-containing protein [Opitutales bacterium]